MTISEDEEEVIPVKHVTTSQPRQSKATATTGRVADESAHSAYTGSTQKKGLAVGSSPKIRAVAPSALTAGPKMLSNGKYEYVSLHWDV